MSVRISVLCEDHTYDQYLVEPVIRAALAALGRPNAVVDVKSLPKGARGIDQLIARLCDHLVRWGGPSTAVIFVADGDCKDGVGGREDRRIQMLSKLAGCDRHRDKGLVVVAIQETEVWALWGVRTELGVTWDDVRSECHPKERFFERYLDDSLTPDGGRRELMRRALDNGWDSLKFGCPELQALEEELKALL